MYYPGDGKYYWLASPSASASGDVLLVSGLYGGCVTSNAYNGDIGFCPLVSLKSSVNLKLAD